MYNLNAIYGELRDKTSSLFRQERQMVLCLYEKLKTLENGGDPLFLMWSDELEFTYGNLGGLLSKNAKLDPAALGALYGLERPEAVDLPRLLKSMQTFYSVLIKLIAYNVARGERQAQVSVPSVLSGEAFRALGVLNFCCEDWYSWVLKYWDAETEAHCRGLLDCLDGEDTIRSAEEFRRSFRPDCLKRIYETVIPKEIRHALGEYYTPDWLAECTIGNALAEMGEGAGKLRLLDPTCGAGTFLTKAMELFRGENGSGVRAAGFDINLLAVLTAKTNYLAVMVDRLDGTDGFFIPVYHCDVLNMPTAEEDRLSVDVGWDLGCSLPRSLCEKALEPRFHAGAFLALLAREESCAGLLRRISAYDEINRRIIANILLNRIFAYYEEKADLVVGNPPWINWEYLPPKYKEKSRQLWPEYGLFRAKGPERSFSKEDISSLITCVALDRFLRPGGLLSFVLRQAVFQSVRNGAGFRRFRLEKAQTEFRILRVDDLGGIRPFDGGTGRSALVLIRKGEAHRFPVPYRCWRGRKGVRKALRDPEATPASVFAYVDVEELSAFPADRNDPSSVWVRAPEGAAGVMRVLLGSNPYQARTGVFTGGANAVYWLRIEEKIGDNLRVSNISSRAKRKVRTVTAEIEPDCVYPLVQGSDLSQWHAASRAYILCPHTAATKSFPVKENDLRDKTPRTFRYLQGFREELMARKGFAGWERSIQEQSFYAVLRVGAYTFAEYKVAWRYIARSFITAVISPARDPFLGEKTYIPNEKIVYVSTDCRGEAFYLCGVLSSSPVGYCVKCYMNPTSISAHVLGKLNIPRYDASNPLHREIAALCEAGHEARGGREELQEELDRTVGLLYGIPEESVKSIRAILKSEE